MFILWCGNNKKALDLIKDFGINIPKESEKYKLCLRKIDGQPFNDYNGLIDFPNKNILLNKIANYLRYSFKDGQLLSLLMDKVYESKDKNNSLTINLDNDFNFN